MCQYTCVPAHMITFAQVSKHILTHARMHSLDHTSELGIGPFVAHRIDILHQISCVVYGCTQKNKSTHIKKHVLGHIWHPYTAFLSIYRIEILGQNAYKKTNTHINKHALGHIPRNRIPFSCTQSGNVWHECTEIRIYVYIFIYIYIHIHIHIYIFLIISYSPGLHFLVHRVEAFGMNVQKYVPMYIYIHTYTHTHTYTCRFT